MGVFVVLLLLVAPVVVVILVVARERGKDGPKQATLYSPDGRWWWDGQAWQPVPLPTGLQSP
jgi:hypothetical protein